MSRPVNPEQRCTPVAEWPEVDQVAWAFALRPADPFEPVAGYANRWAPTSQRAIENGYGRWLGWLDRKGLLDAASAPGQRATRERVGAYLEMLRAAGQAGNTIAGRLQQLGNALKAMSPDQDWSWILRGSSRIRSEAVPVRDQIGRMQPVEDIVDLGEDMMQAAERDRFRSDCDRATLFRDGLIIALLAHLPLRRENFASIALGRHLVRQGEQWRLSVADSETKTRSEIDCAWPDSLVEPLEHYLSIHREVLLRGVAKPKAATNALWVSRRGGGMSDDAIYVQVCAHTKAQFGKSINLHSFRHVAATTIATANPEGVTDIMGVLGHATMGTSEKYYNKAKSLDAGDAHQGTIARLRKRRK